MSKRLLGVCAILCLVACQESTELRAPPPLPDGAEPALESAAELLHPAILPAHKLPWEDKVPGKADAPSDYRKAHPQWFAITEGPAGSVRPMKEWEPMQAMLLTWTNSIQYDEPVAQTLVDIAVGALGAGEVWVIYKTEVAKNNLISRLMGEGVSIGEITAKMKWYNMDNDSIWHIDYGPLPLVKKDDHTLAFADFKYYHQRYRDDAIPTRLGNILGINTYRSPFDYEGGNFQADGEEFCYFGQRVFQYTGMSFQQVENVMKKYYGCQKAVVLKDITDDGTGHIDMFFKLCGKHCAIVGEYTVVSDPVNKARMDDNAETLESLVYSDGSPGITVWRLPFPHKSGGTPRTFLNSTLFTSADAGYRVNLWPMYTVDKDLEAEALQVWEEAMPDWDHVGIVSDKISLYSGAVHCVTRTIPAMPFAKWVPDGQCVNGVCHGEEGAYDGACIPASEPVPGCWGPEWKCLCNNCISSSCQVPASCGNGQCSGSEGCFSCPQDCGCGEGATCSMFSGDCISGVCGDGECSEGETCASCDADCGCAGALQCAFGVCVAEPCGGITYDGCCDGDTLVYCDAGELVVTPCGADGCGWLPASSWYDCGGNGADPGGGLELDCYEYAYPPGCEGKECGDNGGGYSCGQCPGGQACSPQGQCEACVPQCGGKECGDDGCGGTCGQCGGGEECSNGSCTCLPFCAGKDCGDDGCGGACGQCGEGEQCSNGLCTCAPACEGMECGEDGCGGSCGACADGEYCPAGQCECQPHCVGKECGADGCGGNCGLCPDPCTGKEHDPHLCADGHCETPCCPDCEGKECGDDGCGAACGECEQGEGCADSQCVPVTCADACGEQSIFGCFCDEDCPSYDDCCPDICDACPDLSHCLACVPGCGGKECGDDGCSGVCGVCPEGSVCSPQNNCVGTAGPEPEADVVTQVPSGEDLIEEVKAGGAIEEDESDGCSTRGAGDPAGILLLLALAMGIAFVRRAFSLPA